jgi:large subunit ribosomal protein L30
MAKIKITQIKSRIGSNKIQKQTLDALGLTRLQKTVEKEATPQILGMVRKVSHLVKVADV